MVQAQLCFEWPWLRYWSPVQIFCYHQINSLRQNLYSDLWDSYKRGQLLGNEGIAGSPMSASVPAGFKDGLSRI